MYEDDLEMVSCWISNGEIVNDMEMYVYILKSLVAEDTYYTGLSDDVDQRIDEHNRGLTFSTRDCKPWKLVCSIWFENSDNAERFERYLKSGSGRAFAKRHLR